MKCTRSTFKDGDIDMRGMEDGEVTGLDYGNGKGDQDGRAPQKEWFLDGFPTA